MIQHIPPCTESIYEDANCLLTKADGSVFLNATLVMDKFASFEALQSSLLQLFPAHSAFAPPLCK